MTQRVLLSWSSGKDSAWALHLLRQQPGLEVVGLLTTFNQSADRVAMHAVRHALVEAQAAASELPLWPVDLPYPCSNEQYAAIMAGVIAKARAAGITHMAFGDLFLEDIRAYRETQLKGTGIAPLFPLWGRREDTPAQAREMLAGGLRAVLTCVDPAQLPAHFCGREFDARLLEELPAAVDACGENGEFHTFCHAGPMFTRNLPITVGERLERDGFCFTDLTARDAAA
ncbi:MAG: adenine nucleotide alpha hydrolase [Proteobacteria bacterium]|nr:adenine nucleotide alpha hydrolase [Pseudomonadota bacterium]